MAAPAGIRRELAARFPTYERTYTRQRVDLQPEQRPQDQVRQILYGWPPALQNTAGQDEPALRQLVTAEMLREWVDLELDPAALEWDGGPDDARLRYRIIERGDPYTALVYQGKAAAGRQPLRARRGGSHIRAAPKRTTMAGIRRLMQSRRNIAVCRLPA
jgi:hypothetical protein